MLAGWVSKQLRRSGGLGGGSKTKLSPMWHPWHPRPAPGTSNPTTPAAGQPGEAEAPGAGVSRSWIGWVPSPGYHQLVASTEAPERSMPQFPHGPTVPPPLLLSALGRPLALTCDQGLARGPRAPESRGTL